MPTLEEIARDMKQKAEAIPFDITAMAVEICEIMNRGAAYENIVQAGKLLNNSREMGIHRIDTTLDGVSVRLQFSKTIMTERIRYYYHLSIALMPKGGAPNNDLCDTVCRAFFTAPAIEQPSELGNCRQFVWPQHIIAACN
jgi:hypothetical protein